MAGRWQSVRLGLVGLLLGGLLWGSCLPAFPRIECQPCPCGDSRQFSCDPAANVCLKVGEQRPAAQVCGTAPLPDGMVAERFDAGPEDTVVQEQVTPPEPRDAGDSVVTDPPVERPDTEPPPDEPVLPLERGVRKRCLCPGVGTGGSCDVSALSMCTLAGTPLFQEALPEILSLPVGVTRSKDGTLYVSDTGNHSIWRLSVINGSRQVTILAGTGQPGARDGIGKLASFREPTGLVLDERSQPHTLYIVDNGNEKIRSLNLNTLEVKTVAGTGTRGSLDGPGSKAQFAEPVDVAIDSKGDLYVSDAANHRIRKVVFSSDPTVEPQVSTWAGNSGGLVDGVGRNAAFSTPFGLIMDANDNLYVADAGNNLIRRVDPTQRVKIYAGSGRGGSKDGTFAEATFSQLADVAIDGQGNLYVTNRGNHSVRKLSNGRVETLTTGYTVGSFSDGPLSSARFNGPLSIVASPSGALWVTESSNRRVRHIEPGASARVTTVMGHGPPGYMDGPGGSVFFGGPRALVALTSGNNTYLYIADDGNHMIRRVNVRTGETTTLAGNGTGAYKDGVGRAALFHSPRGITAWQGKLYIADTESHAIRVYNPATQEVETLTGGPSKLGSGGTSLTDAKWNAPSSLVASKSGRLYVSDTGNNTIREINLSSGAVRLLAGNGKSGFSDHAQGANAQFFGPVGLALSPGEDVLYVADRRNNAIRKISLQAPHAVETVAGSGIDGAQDGVGGNARFWLPAGLIASAGVLYVADTGNHRLRQIKLSNNEVTTLGGKIHGYIDGDSQSFRVAYPSGLAFGPGGTYLYLAELGNHAIRRITLP